jgi:phosphatidylinositol glycan class Q protein
MAALSSLWKLFRGKKKNVLKRRIDSCHFDVDQLLMVSSFSSPVQVLCADRRLLVRQGTILFTLIFFLFPTVMIYYIFFSIVRFLITLVEAALWFLICFYNHFPFFSVGVFALDRGRLPGQESVSFTAGLYS